MTAGFLEGTFTSFDRRELFYRFLPGSEPGSDTLVILHGHGEHSGRYQKFASKLKTNHLSITAYDFRGHGQSEGPEVYIESFEEYIEDVSAFLRFLQEKYSVTGKIILLGHSVGGLVAVHWALRNPEKIRALILSSPCLGLNLPAPLVRTNQWLNRWVPKFLYQNPVYPPHLTHNPEEVENYKKDTRIKRKMSVRLLSEMLSYTSRLDSIDAFRFPFPVYILMADMEKVVDRKKTSAFFEKVQAPAKKMEIFSGFYHEIFNELDQDRAFRVLQDCLTASQK